MEKAHLQFPGTCPDFCCHTGYGTGDPGQVSGSGMQKARPLLVASALGIICRGYNTLPSSHSFSSPSPARPHTPELALPTQGTPLLEHSGQSCGIEVHSLPGSLSPVP